MRLWASSLLLATILPSCSSSHILVIAHRGYTASSPGNSLAAIEAAIQLGCDVVEMDVRLTSDGIPVLSHDAELPRTAGLDGPVAQVDSSDLSGPNPEWPGSRSPIPTLEEALRRTRGKVQAYLDLKVDNIEPVLQVARQLGVLDEIYWRAYTSDQLRRLKHREPRARLVFGVGPVNAGTALFPVLRERFPDLIVTMPIERVSDRIWEDFFENRFLDVLGKDVDSEKLRRAIDLSPSAIQTDKPDLLLELLGRR